MTPADLDILTEVSARIHQTVVGMYRDAINGLPPDPRLERTLRRSLGQMVKLLEDGPRQLRDSDFPEHIQRIARGPTLAFTRLDQEPGLAAKGDNFVNRGRINDTDGGAA